METNRLVGAHLMTAIAMDAAFPFDMRDGLSLAFLKFNDFFRAGAHACPASYAFFRIHSWAEGKGIIQHRPDKGKNPLGKSAPGLSGKSGGRLKRGAQRFKRFPGDYFDLR